MGDWSYDERARRWVWDRDAPCADESPTRLRNLAVQPAHRLGTARQEDPMTSQQPQGGDDLVAYDPDDPHDPTGSFEPPAGFERPGVGLTDPITPDIAVCPTCGTAVGRDRLRG